MSKTAKYLMVSFLFMQMHSAFTAEAVGEYVNPVLVETIRFGHTNNGANQFTGTMGIGDPSVLFYKDRYYLYPTGDNRGYDVYISRDLVTWRKGPRIFRTDLHGAWAPDVFYNSRDKKFYLYYTVDRSVGIAVADQPDSTFQDKGVLIKGAIDAHMFLDEDGRYYLYYATFPEFKIFVQPMESPVLKNGDPFEVLKPNLPWERKPYPVVEAPWMIKYQGTYYLLYSGGGADTQHYAIGYATAQSPAGPFTKYSGNPIVKKGKGVLGPGHCSVIKSRDGKLWMVYHQQKDESRGWNRIISIDPLWFDAYGVLHTKASRGVLQPAPVVFIRTDP